MKKSTQVNASLSPVLKSVTPPIQHGEGPCWDPAKQVLYYMDTFAATVYRWHSTTDSISSYKFEGHNSIGIVVPIKNRTNVFLIGADRMLYKFTWPENVRMKPQQEQFTFVDNNKPANQFNDGKCDSKGRLWIGTLTRNADLTVTPNGGHLYMINGNDSKNHQAKISNTSISNGIAWSKNNTKFYFIDSHDKTVVEYAFSNNRGNLGARRTIFDLRDHPDLKGIPDGMTIDTNDELWIALFGGHSVINVNPTTGKLKRILKIPATYVTSACFGGPTFDVLYVTTSRLHLNESQLKQEPLAGSVFAVFNLGVKGLPPNEFILN